jgi:hypothetical protein
MRAPGLLDRPFTCKSIPPSKPSANPTKLSMKILRKKTDDPLPCPIEPAKIAPVKAITYIDSNQLLLAMRSNHNRGNWKMHQLQMPSIEANGAK